MKKIFHYLFIPLILVFSLNLECTNTPIPPIDSSKDTQAPTIPKNLKATEYSTKINLSWNASTDNRGVTEYEVFINNVSNGTTSATNFIIMGLTPLTTYSLVVKAGDAAGNWSAESEALDVITKNNINNSTKLPIGMNLPDNMYWQPGTVFTDVMKSASGFIYYANGQIIYDGQEDIIPNKFITLDENGYPTSVPQSTNKGTVTSYAFILNNNYSAGKYNIFFDGQGTLSGCEKSQNGQYYINLNGNGEAVVISVTSSTMGNHIRNIRILPEKYKVNDSYPVFNSAYLEGLKPFHCLRFMDWFHTNNSFQMNWADRVTKNSSSQGRGMVAYEYAIELCNTLDADAWVCVPHMASDDYIRQMATLWKNGLKSGLKIYLEYSNEVWNWGFWQTNWIDNNGIYADGSYPAVDGYIHTDLKAIENLKLKNGDIPGYPEKDAYMMARVFRIWAEVFGNDMGSHVVRVGTGQQGWVDNSRRILEYLFDIDSYHTGCDAFSVGGYIGMEKEQHDIFMSYGQNLTFDIMYDTMIKKFEAEERNYTLETAEYARNFGVDYLVYEGGQHMLSYNNQSNWSYLQKLYDFQIQPQMYNLYSRNFSLHTSSDVDCKLFMAYNYFGLRKSVYGSWGHLESLKQIGTDYMVTAPKYQALLDANTMKE
jgi:hypothetical protein